jgi:hypothetical protein
MQRTRWDAGSPVRDVLFAVVAVAWVAAALTAVATAAPARVGVLTGTIRFVGGAFHPPGRSVAGDVRVFTASGKFVTRRHVRAGRQYRFRLSPGRYLLTTYRSLHPPKPVGSVNCPAAAARIRAGQTSHVDVQVGCGIP